MNRNIWIVGVAITGLIAGSVGCGIDSNAPSNITPQSLVNDTRPMVYLEGLYATSNAAGQEVQRLFDENAATGWQTQPGAGPDEGIMLYFRQPVPLSAVEITPETGSFTAENGADTAQIVVYINGSIAGAGRPGTLIKTNNQPAKSLYFRFESTGKETTGTSKIGDATVETSTFPANASIAIKAVNIYNAQSQNLRIVPPRQVRGRITASSTLAPEAAYSPANLFDAKKEFAWAEGNAADGTGETLRFELSEPVHLTAIQIWNGYQRSDEHFTGNTRLKDFTFGLMGSTGNTYHLQDNTTGQKIDFSAPLEGKNFEMTIQNTYPGKKYKDLAISEMVFYDGDQPFVVLPEQPVQFIRKNRDQAAPSPLSTLLDKRIYNIVKEGDVYTRQSLILRSDGTFVLYQTETYGDDQESKTLADGNWELQAADSQQATVKVFGKWNNLSQLMEYYEGSTKEAVTRIFKDIITIDNQTVTGEKMIGKFYR